MTARKCLAPLLAALLFTALPAKAQFKLDLDSLGKSKDGTLPSGLGDVLGKVQEFTGGQSTDEEARSGDTIAATVLGAAPVWRNPAAQNYVNLVGRNLARQVERRDVTWRFAVLDTPSVNATAFPGGIVVVTRGLYRLLASEDELAAVLAHEIAHVNRKHQWKVIQKQKLIAMAGEAVTKGGANVRMGYQVLRIRYYGTVCSLMIGLACLRNPQNQAPIRQATAWPCTGRF